MCCKFEENRQKPCIWQPETHSADCTSGHSHYTIGRVSAFSGLECWTGVLDRSTGVHWNGVLEGITKNETWNHAPVVV